MAMSPKSMKTTSTHSSIPPIIVKSTFVWAEKSYEWKPGKLDEVFENDPLPDFEQEDYVLLANLERKDGEREDDDGGDPCRDDHCVRVVLHAHLVISMLGKGNVF